MSAYSEKLKDPRWQKLRLEIMQRDGFACRHCFSKTKTLNVHHLAYHKDPWDSPEEELITVCEECHEHLEMLKDSLMRMMESPQATRALRGLASMYTRSGDDTLFWIVQETSKHPERLIPILEHLMWLHVATYTDGGHAEAIRMLEIEQKSYEVSRNDVVHG